MEIKLNEDKDWRYVREKVFIEEQGFTNEFDDIDARAIHVTVYDDETLIGCGRIYPSIDPTIYHLGRLAILKESRKKGYGSRIVAKLELEANKQGALYTVLDAQEQAIPFYEKLGYKICGSRHMDEHVPHYEMKKAL